MTGARLGVTYVVPDLGIGGAERHAATLVSRLDRSRFDASLVCIGRRGEMFASVVEAGVPAVAFERSKRQALQALVDLVQHFRASSPDVVILRGFNAEFLGRVAALVARVPHIVVWVHNCGDVAPRGVLRRVSDRVLDRVTDAYFGVARRQIPYIVDELALPERKVRIIHNGVDVDLLVDEGHDVRSELGFETRHLVVGTLAALRPEKDLATFLRAAALVAADLDEARFLVVGDGQCRQELEQVAQDLGISERVVFAGQRDDVGAVLATLDVFVLSSYTVECFPMALLEAMACGKPAVCTDVGGVSEIIEEGVTGFLVSPKDPDALAERLLRLLTSSAERVKFGEAGRARVHAEFTIQESVRRAEREIAAVAGAAGSVTRPVRLAFVQDETSIGGIELLMLNVFKAFDPAAVIPRLICLRREGPLGVEFRAAGFDVQVLERGGRFDWRTLPKLVKSLRGGRTDAVLVTHHHRASLFFGRLAARLAGVPVNIIAAHDMDLTSVGKRCLPRWAVASLRMSTALVLLTPRQGDYLHREEGVGRSPWSSTREVVIPNGIAIPPVPDASQRTAARAILGLRDDEFVVGIVARLSAQKAHHILIEAFRELARTQPLTRLVVVGGGDREAELRALSERLGVEDRVLFTGIRRDVPALLPAFDVTCLSSVHEGVPMTVIESMAAGVPVVATACGSLPDMVIDGEQGFIVPVGDVAALAARLAMLAQDPALRVRMGLAARQRVERMYSIDHTARGYEKLLTDAVGAR